MSDLHKKNLASLLGSDRRDNEAPSSSSYSSSFLNGSYRDRAQERRKKFGLDAVEPRNTLKV